MVHTLPPWTSKWRMATIFGQIDQGELAARLGSINSFDRRGDTVFMEDFEAPVLTWTTTPIGTGSDVSLSAASYKNGSQSLKITAGSTSPYIASATKHLALPTQSRLGFECSFSAHDDLKQFAIASALFDGTTRYVATILYDHNGDHIDYYNSGGTYTQIASGIKFKADDNMFMPLKFVIDSSTSKYVRMLFGDTEYDLSDIALWSTASALNPYVSIIITIYGSTGKNPISYIDNVILTQNEQ